ncbi:ABC transporter permease [Microbulbifer rhizosphaerae]|uniref:Transport permease protein n=1 Tax=Microbulbifer rhizosphaerae TaxID=1562603 RepID=A0A7W4WD00_9GAMM|nr:ABC transporter permease [Microbulbifer rhizosphaerae]MBB3061899.1 capsular polysaccharide transport system permease protein [Microbulbifer rhizosphaerae]
MNPTIQRNPWQIQRDVIHSLLVREMKTRFGKWRLGYAWVLLEPAMHIMLLAAIFSFMGREFYPGIPTTLFMLAGIAPFLFFSHSFTKSLAAVESNRGLFNYRQLRPFDAVVTRVLLEFAIYLFSMVALLGILAWFGVSTTFNNFLLLVAVNVLYLCFCLGLSLALCVAGEKYPEAAKFGPMIQRPLYFMSGVFFSLEQIPEEYHPYLSWNPLLHMVELTREGLFASYHGLFANLGYFAFCSLGMLGFGLLVYRSQWRDLVRSQ